MIIYSFIRYGCLIDNCGIRSRASWRLRRVGNNFKIRFIVTLYYKRASSFNSVRPLIILLSSLQASATFKNYYEFTRQCRTPNQSIFFVGIPVLLLHHHTYTQFPTHPPGTEVAGGVPIHPPSNCVFRSWQKLVLRPSFMHLIPVMIWHKAWSEYGPNIPLS